MTGGSSFIVSAPGKVIIFGEHSAVYGKPAIAAALSLRCYLSVSPSKDDINTIRLLFPDIQLDHSWDRRSLPWDVIKKHVQLDSRGKPQPPSELVPELVDCLSPLLKGFTNKVQHIACFCFLYLYSCLCNDKVSGMTFVVRSTLPIGAGLGSSASTSVCLSAALAKLSNCIQDPQFLQKELVSEADIAELEFIDQWSLIGEKCFHGNPSGIDNAVATHGGAVMFQRTFASNPENSLSSRTNIRNFPAIKLLLTNTKVPKSTAELVSGVAYMNSEFPEITGSILDSMDHLAQRAYETMIHKDFGKNEAAILRKLVNINHGLLVALGVSHPALETVKIVSDRHKLGATKLTGAGGGGCAITLVSEDADEADIHNAMNELSEAGFESFETALGGKGVGMLFMDDVTNNKDTLAAKLFSNYESPFDIEDAAIIENIPQWRFW
ncbi:ERG12 [Candida oxycetoniae]|uniref:Mevalonate kinase n=1 Tax=Candida oxycetoniae TaxID=497107 RepID=A0AAI9STC7_9ASCO|nr:ERG12 [Candida oxycetoniae]KAI3402660.2 ERG12 [Candida oxycetoniae]